MSVVLQCTFTKLTCPVYVQLNIIQFLPSAGSETKLLSLKSNSIYYIIVPLLPVPNCSMPENDAQCVIPDKRTSDHSRHYKYID